MSNEPHPPHSDMSDPTTTTPDDKANPLRMFTLGLMSLAMAVLAAPVVVQAIYPLMTSAERGDLVPIESDGAFVVAATLFIALYKLLEGCWRRFMDAARRTPDETVPRRLERLKAWWRTAHKPIGDMVAVVCGLLALIVVLDFFFG